MSFKITILPGDGVGPEVCQEAVRILRALGHFYDCEFRFEEHAIGGAAITSHGSPLPQQTLDACLASDAVFLGAVGAPEFDHLPPDRRPEAGLLNLRSALGGFANLRPSYSFPAIADCSPLQRSRVEGADVLIVRELLGGLYFSGPRGFGKAGDYAYNTMRYSTTEIERVARIGFAQARQRRKQLTSVDKANVLETSRLWRSVTTRVVREEFPELKLEHQLVDSFAMNVIAHPSRFDVVVTENMFGDILTDEASVLCGSIGLLPSASLGAGTRGLFEPIHGSAPDIAGFEVANPYGAILSAAMLLRHSLRLEREARAVEEAVSQAIELGALTGDLAPHSLRPATTEEVGDAVLAALQQAS